MNLRCHGVSERKGGCLWQAKLENATKVNRSIRFGQVAEHLNGTGLS